MATIVPTHIADEDARVKRLKWAAMANGDVGTSVNFDTFQDRCVQITGTFGAGGSVSIKGSNDDGTNWVVLTDPLGNPLTFTSSGMKQITELPHLLRPEVTAGDGTTSLTVWINMRGQVV